jgi:hypothetical protein
MHQFFRIKFSSLILLVVMLTATINGVYECAHAMPESPAMAGEQISAALFSSADQCPCPPLGQQNDCDGCDTCVDCVCASFLTSQRFHFSYNPSLQDLHRFEPFTYLPEVYLSLFVPPQSQA